MTFNSLSKLFVVVLIGALFGCASPLKQGRDLGEPASISDAPAPVVVSQGEGIKVTVAPLKQSVELGEPVYLALRVTNEQDKAVTIFGNLRPGDGLVEIYSTGAKEEKKLLAPFSVGDFGKSITLAPKQTIGDAFPIFFGANGWNFKEPGEYRIFAKLKVPAKEGYSVFTSEPAVIKVASSKAGQALFSADDRITLQAGKFLLWRSGDHLKAGIEHLTKFSKQYPDSALSSYISAALVNSYSEPFANYMEREVRAPMCRKAGALRETMKRDVLTENLLIEDFISQAKCHAENRKWSEARKALDAGLELAKDKPEFKAYADSIEEMIKRLGEYV